MAAGGGGRNDSRVQGPCGFDMTNEAPLFVHRQAAMTSPQRHRDRREDPRFIVGNGRAPAPCPQWWRFVSNKANLGRVSSLKFQVSSRKCQKSGLRTPRELPLRTNKANWTGIGGQGSGVSDLTSDIRPLPPWAFVRNKANSAGSRIGTKLFA